MAAKINREYKYEEIQRQNSLNHKTKEYSSDVLQKIILTTTVTIT